LVAFGTLGLYALSLAFKGLLKGRLVSFAAAFIETLVIVFSISTEFVEAIGSAGDITLWDSICKVKGLVILGQTHLIRYLIILPI
jgi:hypothetical protein